MPLSPSDSLQPTADELASANALAAQIDDVLKRRKSQEVKFLLRPAGKGGDPLPTLGDVSFVVTEVLAKMYRDVGWLVYPDYDKKILKLVQP